jgi:hypothetical protein
MSHTLNRTLVLGLLSVLGLLAWAQPSLAAHPICGTWRQKNVAGESDLKITENVGGDGTFDVQEIGLGNAQGWATFKDGVLTVHWITGDLHGIFRYEIDKEHERGFGKVIFTRYPDDFTLGEERRIDGKKVREVKDSTIRRIGR